VYCIAHFLNHVDGAGSQKNRAQVEETPLDFKPLTLTLTLTLST
jgi:hypothetical protein